ncbi:hypothetical protein NA78x_001723 [Anatilimnocola sp. NA78]|uniref:hypothetical protein n=1 Tax=Anatilimnocola sp. NA78 TaxID=3415683 RepID=UPI003CE4566F
MTASAQYNKNLTIAGISFNRQSNITDDGANGFSAVATPAKALSSWEKSDANTAAGNLAASHGLTTGTYDVYWDGGSRFDVPVTITVNACALDGGSGDDFPATANATVVLAPRKPISGFLIDGDNASIVAVQSRTVDPSVSSACRVAFLDAAEDIIADVEVTTNGDPNVNDIYAGEANRYTGDVITHGIISTANTSADVTFEVGYLYGTT